MTENVQILLPESNPAYAGYCLVAPLEWSADEWDDVPTVPEDPIPMAVLVGLRNG